MSTTIYACPEHVMELGCSEAAEPCIECGRALVPYEQVERAAARIRTEADRRWAVGQSDRLANDDDYLPVEEYVGWKDAAEWLEAQTS